MAGASNSYEVSIEVYNKKLKGRLENEVGIHLSNRTGVKILSPQNDDAEALLLSVFTDKQVDYLKLPRK